MQKMTLLQHFVELRRRILWVAFIFLMAVALGWLVAPWVQEFLTKPLLQAWPDGVLLYNGVTDGLMVRFSLSIMFGVFVIFPVILWHLWAYVSPGLYDKERAFIWPILFMSPVLFLLGTAFAFWGLFPLMFKFFIGMNNMSPVPSVLMPAVRDYLTFAIGLLKVFGLVFQLPLILILLNKFGVLSRETMVKMRRFAIVFIVVIAAVLTPPDIVSQIVLALPMWALFEISILFMQRSTQK